MCLQYTLNGFIYYADKDKSKSAQYISWKVTHAQFHPDKLLWLNMLYQFRVTVFYISSPCQILLQFNLVQGIFLWKRLDVATVATFNTHNVATLGRL